MNEIEKVKEYIKYRAGEIPDAIRWLIKEIEELREERGFWHDTITSDADKIKRYEFALSKIMNTQCFMSNNKMQYTTAGQIAKKALER